MIGPIVLFRQTDLAAPCGWVYDPYLKVACSGVKCAGSNGHPLKAEIGGTPGTASHTISYKAGQSLVGLAWQAAPGDVHWLSGGWIIRMNVTGPPGFVGWIWKSAWVCRIDASCTSVATVASALNFDIPINNITPTVYSVLLSGAAQPAAAETDEVYICLQFHNNTGYNGSITITSDQWLQTSLYMKGGATRLVDGGILPTRLVDGPLVA